MTETDEIAIHDNAERHRYEVHLGQKLAGFAEYMLSDGLITFTHTEIAPAFEGRGLASKLVRAALDDVRERGERRVLAVCPFVKGWMAKHSEYLDLAYGSKTA